MNILFLEGIIQISNVFLAIAAGIIASTLFLSAFKKESLKSWIPLIFALILFAIEELLGALKAFNLYSTPHLTHIVPSFIMALLIAAVLLQINIKKRGIK